MWPDQAYLQRTTARSPETKDSSSVNSMPVVSTTSVHAARTASLPSTRRPSGAAATGQGHPATHVFVAARRVVRRVVVFFAPVDVRLLMADDEVRRGVATLRDEVIGGVVVAVARCSA